MDIILLLFQEIEKYWDILSKGDSCINENHFDAINKGAEGYFENLVMTKGHRKSGNQFVVC